MFGELHDTKYWGFLIPLRGGLLEDSESGLGVTGGVSPSSLIPGSGKPPSLHWSESKDILPCKTASGLNRQKYLLKSWAPS